MRALNGPGRIVVLTGAGISAESGLGTFRDAGGLWSRVNLEEVATPEGFARDPGKVHAFYNARRAQARAASPNAAHQALARLEAALGDDLLIVTQNVDDLHERAGARRLLHMHGALDRAQCADCGHVWPAPAAMAPADRCPACSIGAARPGVVWFGEYPLHMDEIAEALRAADLFVAIGTSGTVWPAAGFVEEARAAGARTLELNLAASEMRSAFGAVRLGPASRIVPEWVDAVLAGR